MKGGHWTVNSGHFPAIKKSCDHFFFKCISWIANNFIYGHDSKVLKELSLNFFNRVFSITLSASRKTVGLQSADMKIFINIKQCQDRDIGQHSRVSTEYWWLSSAGHYYQYPSCWTSSVCQPNWQQFILICTAIIKTAATLIYRVSKKKVDSGLI